MASQAPVTNGVGLGISGGSVGNYMVDPTRHLEQVVHSKGSSSPKKEEKESCTIIGFLVQVLVLIWLLVKVALLDRVVALECIDLVLLKFQGPLTS